VKTQSIYEKGLLNAQGGLPSRWGSPLRSAPKNFENGINCISTLQCASVRRVRGSSFSGSMPGQNTDTFALWFAVDLAMGSCAVMARGREEQKTRRKGPGIYI